MNPILGEVIVPVPDLNEHRSVVGPEEPLRLLIKFVYNTIQVFLVGES